MLVCLCSYLLAAARVPAPTLTYNRSRVVTVGWQGAEPAPSSYLLQLSVEQRGQPAIHATKHAASSMHSIVWPDLPEESRACFRVAAIGPDGDGQPQYSDATCYSSCGCSAAAGSSNCMSCAFTGALVGALLTVAAFIACTQRSSGHGGGESVGKHAASLARGLVGGTCYAHVRTAEEAGLEMEESRPPPSADAVGAVGALSSRPALSLGRAPLDASDRAALPALEPPADIHADQFELRWSSCATRSHVLEAVLPNLPASTPDEVETALVERGFFCVAAGAVGTLHKLYFAAQLRGGADWLMLELVLHWETSSAQATFRCDSPHRLIPLADDIGTLLGRVMTTRFNLQRY